MQATTKHEHGWISHTAATALSSGDVVARGNSIGVYALLEAAASGDVVALSTQGVYTMVAKSSDMWSDDDILYWDDTANELTTTVGSNVKAGKAVGDKLSGAITADCDINTRV